MFDQKVIGHRGMAGTAPENTRAAFTSAAQAGIQWVEFDVTLTADHKAVVFHDPKVDRCSDGQGDLSQLALAQIRRMDIGSWFDPKFAGETILTLDQVLRLMKKLRLNFNLEIKVHPKLPVKPLVAQIVEGLKSHDLKNCNFLVSSFDPQALTLFCEQSEGWPIGFLMHQWSDLWQDYAKVLNPISVHCNHEILTPERVLSIREADCYSLAYTVNDSERFNELTDMGVHAVFSDFPNELLKA